ncbi:MAG: BlaI/MecI/CopY family transcriptional regulator [Candidatus Limivicinus sp.]
MDDMKLGAVETRFAEIIWKNEPLSSGELVKLCSKELEWKKSTTYTVLKKLCDRGIFQNNGGTVSSLISADELAAMQSERFVEETFGGSLPAFIAAFTARKHLSTEELQEISRMIDACGRENSDE